MNRVLFISPHPDDETLGCGGTLLKHKSLGEQIYWLIVTNISVADGFSHGTVAKRQAEIASVAKEYGYDEVIKLDFPTTRLDMPPMADIIKAVSNIIQKIAPNILYLPFRNDIHSDHRITFETVMSAAKTFRCPSIKKVMMYETISETEFAPPLLNTVFVPNSFSDITGFLERKISIMEIYKGEMNEHPFPRSADNIKALATFRGATAGVKYAEAFMILKEIW